MGAITLKNFRTTADVTMNTRLKDGGVSIDWAGLTNIKAWLFSDAQKAIAGRCDVSINQADSTLLVCEYSASKPQYLGVNRLIVQAKYQGRTKTYDVPVFNFVSRTAAATGTVTIDDPTVNVEIEVEDVSSSILDAAIAAALAAAADAEHAAHLIPNQVLLDCEAATAVALTAATHAPTIGENGNWWVWNATLEAYEDTGNEAQGPTGNGIASWSVVESQEDAGSNVVTVTFTDGTSETFTYKNGHTGNGIASIVQTVESPDDAGTNVITITMTNGTVVTFNVKNGSKGQPGAAQAAYKSVETLPTASAATMDKIYLTPSGTSGVYNMSYTDYDGSAYSWVSLGTTAIQLSDYATEAEVSQLRQEVTDLTTNVNKDFRDLIGNVIADKTVNVSGTNTTDTGVVLKAGEPYLIYVQCSTATTHRNCGVWVRNASNNFTKIKTLTAEEYAQGAYIEYTPVEDVSLWVRPYSTGSVKVTVWDENAPATITEIVESSITDAILSESFQYSNIASGNDGVTSTNILWPDGATGVMAVTYTNGLPSRVTYSHILDGTTRNFEQVVTYADGDVVSNEINEI